MRVGANFKLVCLLYGVVAANASPTAQFETGDDFSLAPTIAPSANVDFDDTGSESTPAPSFFEENARINATVAPSVDERFVEGNITLAPTTLSPTGLPTASPAAEGASTSAPTEFGRTDAPSILEEATNSTAAPSFAPTAPDINGTVAPTTSLSSFAPTETPTASLNRTVSPTPLIVGNETAPGRENVTVFPTTDGPTFSPSSGPTSIGIDLTSSPTLSNQTTPSPSLQPTTYHEDGSSASRLFCKFLRKIGLNLEACEKQ